MDKLKLPTISAEQFREAAELVEMAMACGSKKDAERYISRIKFMANSLQGRCRDVLARIGNTLIEYCKINSDKSFYGMHLANDMGVFESFIEERETL